MSELTLSINRDGHEYSVTTQVNDEDLDYRDFNMMFIVPMLGRLLQELNESRST